ncbi:hypothetical protein [Stenotrophomonas tumulicola]|uniref:hypothetical protein n=1 Tax=Stenotrophomonas tumulicola TaxID=1685415 RepID=UPI001FE5B1F8|nr:hypothetical protein [Stenotrophomonas tumulicola]
MQSPARYADVIIDLEAEYEFWEIYETQFQRLPGGGLTLAWLACLKIYSAKLNYPRDTPEQTLARVLFGKNMSSSRKDELGQLHRLISRRMDLLARRAARAKA